MIEILYKDCDLSYKGEQVLASLAFHIKEGENACVLGPIGSGKTMLLRSLAGNVQINSGKTRFCIEGKEISKLEFQQNVSLVEFAKPSKYFNPQNHFYQQRYHHQMEDDESSKSMSVGELLAEQGFSLKEHKVRLFLEREKLLDLLHHKLIQLSSGQRRKLQLTIALLDLPKILLLDSPYIGLDAESRNDLNDWLQELAGKNDLQIIVSADQRDLPNWIDKRVFLPPKKIIKSRSGEALINTLTKHEHQDTSCPLIEISNVKIKYGKSVLFEDLNWEVRQGDRVAIIGKNGSGKSTLLSLIYADNPKAYSNSIKMFGTQRGKGDNIWSIKKRTGFVSSELHLYFTENYSCQKVIATGFFDTKFIPRNLSKQEIQLIDEYAHYFDVSHLLNRLYVKTSLGEQKVILLIRALIKQPELLLLDEPYQGFDRNYIDKANKLINSLAKYSNTTIIFISHYHREIPECVDRLFNLTEGTLNEN